MPPQPAAVTVTVTVTILVALLTFFPSATSSHICSSKTLCPPFTSPPSFPFSLSAGCGHPSFQLHCLPSSGASITINNLSFSILQYKSNSTSLTLSPTPLHAHRRNCNSPPTISALNRSISFSGSPFRVSDSSCSRLSVLKPCPPPNLPNCSHCSLECKLIKSPIHLVHECVSSTRHVGECQGDVIGDLDRILRTGFEVEWDEDHDSYFSNCRSCSGICGFNSSNPRNPFLCLPSQSRIQQQNPNRFIILSIVIFFVCLLISLSSGFAIFRSKNPPSLDSEEDPNIIFLRRHSANLLTRVFLYDELKLSTNCFDPKFKIGDGGFGSVYLGHLNDKLVAVKHLHRHNSSASGVKKGFSQKLFCNEILILSSINHPNLVKLHGYCSDPRGLVLVYDYVPNGTLADHLHGKMTKGVLTWNIRIDIAVQIAMAIEYLHFSVTPPVVHRDITCTNIFVEKDMRVKVGDFGLSRLLICSQTNSQTNSWNSSEGIWTGPQGTPGYLDPDYYKSFRLNEKSDIYSFGVVLLELITGMRAVDQNREKREITLVDMVVPRIQKGLLQEVVDPVLADDVEALEGVSAVAELAFQCVAADKDDRPNAQQVAAELKRIKGCGHGGLKVSNLCNVDQN